MNCIKKLSRITRFLKCVFSDRLDHIVSQLFHIFCGVVALRMKINCLGGAKHWNCEWVRLASSSKASA